MIFTIKELNIQELDSVSCKATELEDDSKVKYPNVVFSVVDSDLHPCLVESKKLSVIDGFSKIETIEEETFSCGKGIRIQVDGHLPIDISGKFLITKLMPMLEKHFKVED